MGRALGEAGGCSGARGQGIQWPKHVPSRPFSAVSDRLWATTAQRSSQGWGRTVSIDTVKPSLGRDQENHEKDETVNGACEFEERALTTSYVKPFRFWTTAQDAYYTDATAAPNRTLCAQKGLSPPVIERSNP